MKVWFPNEEETNRKIDRDRRKWNKIYNHNEPGICPDNKEKYETKKCFKCPFLMKIEGRDVRCQLANGDKWIQHKSSN